MSRLIFPLLFGLGGTLVLVMLSYWQAQRLTWKETVIAEISRKLEHAPVDLPTPIDPTRDRYLAVSVNGKLSSDALHIYGSTTSDGAGYRVISLLEINDGRKILLDRGFIGQSEKDVAFYTGNIDIAGNLDWPVEQDGFTPAPDLKANIWFARNVEAMATALGAEPIMLVATTRTGTPSPRPMPVSINIRNNHLQYAITWGLMAVVWLAMTSLLVLRIRRKTA